MCREEVPFTEKGKTVVGEGQEAGGSQEFSFELGRLELCAEQQGLLCPAASVPVWVWPFTDSADFDMLPNLLGLQFLMWENNLFPGLF